MSGWNPGVCDENHTLIEAADRESPLGFIHDLLITQEVKC